VLGWGSTYGAIREAVERCRSRGLDVSHAHVRYLNPFPRNLGDLLRRFDRVLVPELNLGQLVKMIRSQYMIPAESLPKVQGKPFRIEELEDKIRKMLES
jgi:2-oxoglutarate ferredoxin oxidoreductase subunit alpha